MDYDSSMELYVLKTALKSLSDLDIALHLIKSIDTKIYLQSIESIQKDLFEVLYSI